MTSDLDTLKKAYQAAMRTYTEILMDYDSAPTPENLAKLKTADQELKSAKRLLSHEPIQTSPRRA